MSTSSRRYCWAESGGSSSLPLTYTWWPAESSRRPARQRRLERQGRGGAGIDKGQLVAQGDLDFVAVVERLRRDDVAAVEMRAVLAAQVLDLVVVAVPDDARDAAARSGDHPARCRNRRSRPMVSVRCSSGQVRPLSPPRCRMSMADSRVLNRSFMLHCTPDRIASAAGLALRRARILGHGAALP